MPMMPQMTRHPFMENPNMPKPTQNPATPKQAAGGKKNDPHLSTAADQSKEGEGRGSQSDQRPEHTGNIPAQNQTDNPNIDRGETNNPLGQEKREPQDRYSPGLSDHSKVNEGQFSLDQWSRQVFSARIDATSKLLLLALGQLADSSGVCWPTQATIARMMNAGRGTVISAITRMEEAGWLLVDRDRTAQGHKLHHYILLPLNDDEGHVQK
jgi:hypothetical protein